MQNCSIAFHRVRRIISRAVVTRFNREHLQNLAVYEVCEAVFLTFTSVDQAGHEGNVKVLGELAKIVFDGIIAIALISPVAMSDVECFWQNEEAIVNIRLILQRGS